jgi:hypothetical protein
MTPTPNPHPYRGQQVVATQGGKLGGLDKLNDGMLDLSEVDGGGLDLSEIDGHGLDLGELHDEEDLPGREVCKDEHDGGTRR